MLIDNVHTYISNGYRQTPREEGSCDEQLFNSAGKVSSSYSVSFGASSMLPKDYPGGG